MRMKKSTLLIPVGIFAIVVILSLKDPRRSNSELPPGDSQPSRSNDASVSEREPLPPDFPLKLGMTWDEAVPILRDRKRLTPAVWETPDRNSLSYRIGDGAYNLTFERPTSPNVGPYQLIRIERMAAPPPAPSVTNIQQTLKPGTTLDATLPFMQGIGGYFLIKSKDRIAAVLQADDLDYRVTFEPKDVSRPGIAADITPKSLRLMGRIPLNALPEFGAYRISRVKATPSKK